jgi:hypothetical protein
MPATAFRQTGNNGVLQISETRRELQLQEIAFDELAKLHYGVVIYLVFIVVF